jgi:NADPH2:quinone reductase
MRAVLVKEFGPFSNCEIAELPTPQPGPGQVVIRAGAAGLNFPDLLVISGGYQILPPLPFTPGKEVAGTVTAVGEGVTSIKTGDRVLANVENGGYAEEAMANAVDCHRLPDGMDFVTAAALGLVYQTAYFSLIDRASYKRGETVLVTGASGAVGLATVQLARAMGATVIAGVSTPSKADAVRAAGAHHVIDLAVPNLRDGLREQVFAVTGKHGADVLIDPVGGDIFDAALRAMAWCGRAVVVGFAAGRIPTIKANYLLVKNIAVSGLQWSDYRERIPERVAEVQQEIFRLQQEGHFQPHIMHTLPLERFKEGLATIQDRRVIGKIVLKLY